MFLDRVKIRIKAGNGGDGVTAFRREKFVPRGGPSGGDGGVGGSVWMEATEGLNTLLHLRYNPEHKAERGHHGEGSNRSGKDGVDAIVKVLATNFCAELLVTRVWIARKDPICATLNLDWQFPIRMLSRR